MSDCCCIEQCDDPSCQVCTVEDREDAEYAAHPFTTRRHGFSSTARHTREKTAEAIRLDRLPKAEADRQRAQAIATARTAGRAPRKDGS